MFVIMLAVFAFEADIAELISKYEAELQPVLSSDMEKLNLDFPNGKLKSISRCILTRSDISKCMDWTKMFEYLSTLSEADKSSIKSSVYDLTQTEINSCPRSFPVSQNQIAMLNKLATGNSISKRDNLVQQGLKMYFNTMIMCVGGVGFIWSGSVMSVALLSIVAFGTGPIASTSLFIGAIFFLASAFFTLSMLTLININR